MPNPKVSHLTESLNKESAETHSSVGSVANLRTGGRRFDPRLGQYSFRRLVIVFATGFIPLSPLSIVSWLCGKAVSGFERILCVVLVTRTPEKHGQVHWPPRYNRNTVESGVKHHTIDQSINKG